MPVLLEYHMPVLLEYEVKPHADCLDTKPQTLN